jgi:hypothetical protein
MHDLATNKLRQGLIWSAALSLLIMLAGTYSVLQSNTYTVVEQHSYTTQPDDLTPIADYSDLIVEGVVEKVHPAKWTTPDGTSPKDIAKAMQDPNIQLRTPIQLSVERVYKGQNISNDLLFTLAGGDDGKTKVKSETGKDLKQGSRVIVFLSTAPSNAGPWAAISPLYPQMYFVVEGNTLRGPLKDITRADFVEQFGEGDK